MAQQVARVVAVGEILEDQLASAVAPPAQRRDRGNRSATFGDWVNGQLESLKRRVTGDGRTTVSVSQRLKMARFSDAFRAVLVDLPARVDIDSVGSFAVFSEESRSTVETWGERFRGVGDFPNLYNETKTVLGDLVTARTRLDLGVIRLSDGDQR